MTQEQLLCVESLSVERLDGAPIVTDIGFSTRAGKIVGLVGETGSGKTTIGLALLGYARPGTRIVSGSVRVNGIEVIGRSESEAQRVRGKTIAYVPQDAASSLNPFLRVGQQLEEIVRRRGARDAKREISEALTRVNLPAERAFAKRFPHQISGGQQQRVAIAMAIISGARVVVLDEPTTGLDVVTQRHILTELDGLAQETGLALVFISHDLAVVGSLAHHVIVLYGGRVMERGPTHQVLRVCKHPYTVGLVGSVPDPAVPHRLHGIPGIAKAVGEYSAGCPFEPRCAQRTARCRVELPRLEEVGPDHHVRCFEWMRTPPVTRESRKVQEVSQRTKKALLSVESLWAEHVGRSGSIIAVRDVTFRMEQGECLAVVGESGSGKTTLARCLVGLHQPSHGGIFFEGTSVAPGARARRKEIRRRIQLVFQNPYDSLNPRRPVGQAIVRAAQVLRGLSKSEAENETSELLEKVRVPTRLRSHFPSDLSGGERQRVAIARALAAKPDVLICDEITSALDVSVQASILDLLADLRKDLGVTVIFISHDLGVVASIADRVLVLEHGTMRDVGNVQKVLRQPTHSYTRRLIESAPLLFAEQESRTREQNKRQERGQSE